jgi:hypothetical protein
MSLMGALPLLRSSRPKAMGIPFDDQRLCRTATAVTSVLVQTNVHGNGLHHGCNCSMSARITSRAMNSGWRLLSI